MEDGWAELRERGVKAKQRIADLVGGLMSSTEAGALLNISMWTLERCVQERTMLAVPDSDGQWHFPRMQFTDGGRVKPGIAEVTKAGRHVNPWVVLSILVDDVTDGSAILLERLDDPAVLRDVVHRLDTYGEHVAV